MWCVWHGTDILRESRTICIQVLGIFRSANVCALGPNRRYLLLPEEKARIAASKILAWVMKHSYETWHVHIGHGDLTPLRSVCCLTRRCASVLVRSWRETCRSCMRMTHSCRSRRHVIHEAFTCLIQMKHCSFIWGITHSYEIWRAHYPFVQRGRAVRSWCDDVRHESCIWDIAQLMHIWDMPVTHEFV